MYYLRGQRSAFAKEQQPQDIWTFDRENLSSFLTLSVLVCLNISEYFHEIYAEPKKIFF